MVVKLFDELGPRYAKRNGGYLRILKFGFRQGDNAPMALVELMDRPEPSAAPAPRRKPRRLPKPRPDRRRSGLGRPGCSRPFSLAMRKRHLTLIRTGQRIECCQPELEALFQIARTLCPDGFPAEETRELDPLRAHLSLAFVGELRRQLSKRADIPLEWLSLDRFTVHGCGPISLHDDRHNYPTSTS